MDNQPLKGRTVLFVVTEDWAFCSHRLPMARTARDAGARVVVATRIDAHRPQIEAEGFVAEPVAFDRSGLNPIKDLRTLGDIVRVFRRHRPDLVHLVATKPILYGNIAARLVGVPAVVNALTGLGFLFIEARARMLRRVFETVLRMSGARRKVRFLVQNEDDRDVIAGLGIAASKIVTIAGSGVDTIAFRPPAEPRQARPDVLAVCVSRMLWDKGLGELVEAARLLRARGVPIRVRLVGGTDANPSSIPQATLDEWAAQGIVEVVGHSTDIAGEYGRADIAVLPSYREGLPKSLLEAAATGLPMVATDVPGCREVCRDGETGILVPAKDATALAEALATLAAAPGLRRQYGDAARTLVERELSQDIIMAQVAQLYRELVGPASAPD